MESEILSSHFVSRKMNRAFIDLGTGKAGSSSGKSTFNIFNLFYIANLSKNFPLASGGGYSLVITLEKCRCLF